MLDICLTYIIIILLVIIIGRLFIYLTTKKVIGVYSFDEKKFNKWLAKMLRKEEKK